MKKIDPVVLSETKYISVWVIVLSIFMQAVFLVIGKWNYTVVTGNILSAAAGILNFLFMGITVQRAVEKDENEAKTLMKLSQTYRNLALLVVLAFGVGLPWFNTWSVVIPMVFPRTAIMIKGFTNKNK